MSLADDILSLPDDRKEETVNVPEWGVTLVVRELSVKERNAYVNSGLEQQEVAGGVILVSKQDPLLSTRLVVAATYDENGNKVFHEGQVAALADRSASAVDRLYNVAARLSGLGASVDDAGKDSTQTEDVTSSSS
jgi:hypothetical protein